MNKLGIIFIVLVYVHPFVGAQVTPDTIPEEQIIVNKEYDENGNLTGYDSTYIHSWSGDTTLSFDFDDRMFFGEGIPDMDNIMKEFFNDSTRKNFTFPHQLHSSPFNDQIFNDFEFSTQDSLFMRKFNFNSDSIYPFDQNFVFPDLNLLEKELKEHFNAHPLEEFQSPQQKKEWEELMKKHRKEMEEFREKWKEEQK